MKKIFAVASIMLLFASCNVAQAVEHSTQEDFNVIWRASVTAINETADYVNLINNVDYDVAVVRLQDCERHEKILEFYWQTPYYKGVEVKECALLATIIMQERGPTLDYFISAVNAYRVNKASLFEEYMKKMSTCNKQVEQSRQEFRNKYGY